ncbi:MAG TPA: Hint domain-containing protein, partial [Acetobacteraceae bacterium]|nr:Hint domain-containing protein [Acetobacteraceae bacterium]
MSTHKASHIRVSTDNTGATILDPAMPASELLIDTRPPPPGNGTIIFDSTGDPISGTSGIGSAANAQSFTTDASASVLEDIKLDLASFDPGAGTITVSLWTDNGGPGLGTDLGTLATIDDSTLSGTPTLVDITPSGSETLTANTRYWIEVTSTGDGDSWAYSTSTGGPEVATEYVDVNNAVSTDIAGDPWIASIEITSLCFAAGARILAERGEVPVESLVPGDRVVALRRGGLAAIRWIGRRDVDLRRHPSPEKIAPVRIVADAIAPGVPRRDLRLSPDHAVFLDGALVTARYLLNGATIRQEIPPAISYYHIELDTHDLLLAEGLAAESDLDVGNRAGFQNAGALVALHPDFAGHRPDVAACAPRLATAAERAPLRARLLARAETLGFTPTLDPALAVFADQTPLSPSPVGEDLEFALPAGTRLALLRSRTAAPSHRGPEHADGRRLGVGVTHLAFDGIPLALHDPRLATGWHDPEPTLRWTNGAAHLDVSGANRVTLRLHKGLLYWQTRNAACADRQEDSSFLKKRSKKLLS